MSSDEKITSEINCIVDIQLTDDHMIKLKKLAARLLISESEMYQFAITSFIHRMNGFKERGRTGSDLLPFFIGFRSEMNKHMQLTVKQLNKIVNSDIRIGIVEAGIDFDKSVEVSDLELFVLSNKLLREHLMQIELATDFKNADVDVWLSDYLTYKYKLTESVCCE